MTATGNIKAGSRIVAGDVQGVAPLAVIKGADQSLASSTTLQNDNALFVPVVANASYLMICMLDYEGAAIGTGDIKWVWTGPAGFTLRYTGLYLPTSGTVHTGAIAGATTVVAATTGTGNLAGATMVGSIFTGNAAGTLQLQWAQNSPSATATIVHAQSLLSLWRQS